MSTSRRLLAVLLITAVSGCGMLGSTADDPQTGSTEPINEMADTSNAETSMPDMSAEPAGVTEMEMASSAENGDMRREIEVRISEFAFSPASIDLVPGEQVRLVLINEGNLPHEFRLTNQAEIDAHIEGGHEGGHGTDAEEDEHGDEEGMHDDSDMASGMHTTMSGDVMVMLGVAAGETETYDLTVPMDMTMMTMYACLVPGHFELGMKGEVVYTE